MPRVKFKLHDGKTGAALSVRVTPRARKTEVAGIRDDGTLKVRVTSPPVEGKANAALVKFLAEILGVRKRSVEIVAGHRGLDKLISILDMTAEEVEERILMYMQGKKE
ncbi:MAG TPA: YggU family protein [Anaerolineae bacterium]|nr:YggU family protein [Anaerolineae bacterium]